VDADRVDAGEDANGHPGRGSVLVQVLTLKEIYNAL
jgi:hypothetical protein